MAKGDDKMMEFLDASQISKALLFHSKLHQFASFDYQKITT